MDENEKAQVAPEVAESNPEPVANPVPEVAPEPVGVDNGA